MSNIKKIEKILSLIVIATLLFLPINVNAKEIEWNNLNIITLPINFDNLLINDTKTSKVDKTTTTKAEFADILGCKDANNDGVITDDECSNKSSFKCDDNIKRTINKYWSWIAFLVPLLLLLFITIDFFKALTSGEEETIKKSGNNALKRVISAVILLILPTLVKIVFTWFGLENYLCF